MKFLLTCLAALVCIQQLFAQNVGIGTASPHASAMLDVTSTNKGLLVPRVTEANRPASPATGLLIYQTDGTPGFYYYNGSTWQMIGGGSGFALPYTGSTAGNAFNITSTDANGITGASSAGSGNWYGGQFTSASTSGSGLYAAATAATGITYGGQFANLSTSGRGVYGEVTASTGNVIGVYGKTSSSTGIGVYGESVIANSTDVQYSYGVYGKGKKGYGVYGESDSLFGVYGLSNRPINGTGVFGLANSQGNGVEGWSGSATPPRPIGSGVSGRSQDGAGVSGRSQDGAGVFGSSIGGASIMAWKDYSTGNAGNFQTFNADNISPTIIAQTEGQGSAVKGYINSTTSAASAIDGQTNSTTGIGVTGTSTATTGTTIGVRGFVSSPSAYAIAGFSNNTSGSGIGVRGQSLSPAGFGVYGIAASTTGVNYGVFGNSSSSDGRAVSGVAYALTGTTFGVTGESMSPNGYGGFFFNNAGGFALKTAEGKVAFETLAGAGSRMVVADVNGNLSTQAIPSGGLTLPYNQTSTEAYPFIVRSSAATYNSAGIAGYSTIPGSTLPLGGGIGVYGASGSGTGVAGESSTGTGVTGFGQIGVYGTTNGENNNGGYFENYTPTGLALKTASGGVQFDNLAGTGNRMVIADATGKLSTQAIPNGGGGSSPWTTSGNNISNSNTGNVGIGASSPGAKLDVFQNTDVWHSFIGGSTGRLQIGGQTTTGAVIQSWNPTTNVARDLFLQRDGGNVGIGTITPNAKLEVASSASSYPAIVGSSIIQGNTFGLGGGTGVYGETGTGVGVYGYSGANGGAGVIGQATGSDGIGGYFDNSNGNGLALKTLTGGVQFENLAGTGNRMVIADAAGKLSTQAIPNGGGGSSPWTTSGNNISNNNSGNVGIGTGGTAPAAKLDVNGNGIFSAISSLSQPQLVLAEQQSGNFSRLNFKNINQSSYWTIAGLNTNSAAGDLLNFYHSTAGDVLSISGDKKATLNGSLNIAATGGNALAIDNGFIKVSGANRTAFQVVTSNDNTTGNYTSLTYMGASATDIVTVTPVYEGTYLKSPIGLWFFSNEWRVFRQDEVAMPIGVKFNVIVMKQ